MEYFTENGNVEEPEYKIGVRISYCAKPDTAITKYFPRADYAEAGITYNNEEGQVKYEKDLVLSKASLTLPNTGMNKSGTDYFEFLRDSVGNGKILTDKDALYLEIKFFVADEGKETNVNYAYLFDVDGNAVIYKNKEDIDDPEAVKLAVATTNNSYTLISVFKEFLENNYTVDGFPLRWDDGWTVTARYVINPEKNNYLFEGDWTDAIVFEAGASITMPKTAQISYDGANFVFFSAFDSVTRGGIFTTGGVDKVELHFYQGETEETEYCIDVTYNGETKRMEFAYTSGENKVNMSNSISDASITNGYCTTPTMATLINEYLTGIESGKSFTGEWKMYTVTHLRSGSKVFSGGDENGNVKSDEYTYTA